MKKNWAYVGFLTMAVSACGGSAFTGGSGQRVGATENGGAKTPSTTTGADGLEGSLDAGKGDQIDFGSSDDDKAIETCLAKFGNHPFNAQTPYRKVSASVQVLGFGKGIVDDQVTDQPELILISAAVNVLGKSVYEFKNPNGWYCLKVDVNVKADTLIELHCDAKLADNKVNVAVGGSSQATGRVGVHVLSDVAIERVGNCGG